jgi:ferric-dicitrate binding protein FerR (iron transport regulator)
MLAQVTDSGVTVRSGITTRDYTAWTEGSLVFKGVALRDVLVELGRAYGTTIRVEDTVLAKQPLVLDVSVQRHPLTQVLDLIGLTVDAHYTRDGQTYLVSPGPKSTRMQQRQRFPQLEKRYGL